MGPVEGWEDEVLQDFVSPGAECIEGAYFLLEELETADPDLKERCGLLADRYEVYAMGVPRCPHLTLAVSLDTAGPRPWPCAVHGLLARRGQACDRSRRRAARHFDLIDPSWEPTP